MALKQLVPCRLRKPLRRLSWQYRLTTWRRRALPDFIIIGAQKSGTTTLHSYLSQHPQILPSTVKEIHYFDGGIEPATDTFARGESWYRAHFPLRQKIGANQKAFDATPLYIFNPLCARRIYDLVPKAKLIALLRDPTERAISQYFHSQRENHEPLSIMDALHREEERLAPLLTSGDYKSETFIHNSYKSRGRYREQFERYLEFFSEDQLLIISSEEFFSEPRRTLERVFRFIGVDSDFEIADLRPRNVASNRSSVDHDVYDYLTDYFRPHNEALYELLNQRFDW